MREEEGLAVAAVLGRVRMWTGGGGSSCVVDIDWQEKVKGEMNIWITYSSSGSPAYFSCIKEKYRGRLAVGPTFIVLAIRF